VAQAIVDGGDDLLAVLERVEGGPAFLVTLRQFLGRHGHLGPAFVDLAAPTWGEEPARLLSEIQGRLLHETEDPEIRRARLEAEADAKAEAARRSLRDRPEVLRRFEEALAVAREAAPELEAQHDALEQKGPRRLVLQAGARLAAEGMLARADDVFFLHAREVSAALRQPGDVRPLVARRKADHERWAKVQPPRHLGRHAEAFAAMERHAAGGGRPVEVLKGTGASGGRARGPARIVLSESDFPRVQAGDILVCPTTAPSWVPLFDGVAGLVANTGGLLCHAAILAREFGVPAVVGARDATRRFRDGQIIEVDGGAGTVAAVEDGYKYQTAS
jgi:pyruvate,water dikinase